MMMPCADKGGLPVTDLQLERAKKLAITFLHLPMKETKFSPIVVQHPFFEGAIMMDKEGMFNALEDEARYHRYVRNYADKVIGGCDTLEGLLCLIRKSYRLTFLLYLQRGKIVSTKECGNLLAGQWCVVENLSHDTNVPKATVLRWVVAADKEALMDEGELSVYHALPDEVTVYRGCRTESAVKGMSWSLSEKKAKWFADRLSLLSSCTPGGESMVFCAKIKKEDVIGYLYGRGEEEIIVDYRKLYNIGRVDYE